MTGEAGGKILAGSLSANTVEPVLKDQLYIVHENVVISVVTCSVPLKCTCRFFCQICMSVEYQNAYTGTF